MTGDRPVPNKYPVCSVTKLVAMAQLSIIDVAAGQIFAFTEEAWKPGATKAGVDDNVYSEVGLQIFKR